MPTPYGSRGGMAFSADELRVLRRALDIALRPDTVPHRPGPARDAEVRDCLRLAEAMAEADHEADRLRAFLLAELARYRAALPGAAPGYARLLKDALADGYPPGPEDLAALRSLCALPTGDTEAARRRALLRRCEHLAEQTLRTRSATTGPVTTGPATPRPATPRSVTTGTGTARPGTARLAPRATPAIPGVPGARPQPGPEPVHTHPSCALPVRTRLLALPGGRTPHAAEAADPKPGVKPPPPGKPAPTSPPPATPQPKAPPRPDRPIPTPGEVFPPRRKPAPPPGAASGLPAARPA
ncbi:hypothetical protein ACGFLS_21035 [Streptomyces abikoensis]|uniref:hypothetical protein n=1 Tax=Streptomyces abikoensis TaxID=97398 RepID=UPI0037224B6C